MGIEYTSKDETAVCNLASISLPRLVFDKIKKTSNKELTGSISTHRYFNFIKLTEIVQQVTYNLNQIIDINYYPVETARRSNILHRPIGLGVQGLADVFIILGISFDSLKAQQLNKEIFECIYYSALEASCELAQLNGYYSSYKGSPISKGILQHDMWGVNPPTKRWDWKSLRADISNYGVRNSLLVAPMPTASTSQILGNNECFEPYTSNIYVRRTLADEFVVINQHLLKDLISRGIWNKLVKNKLIAANGSVQNIDEIPTDLKAIYKTVWEISQKNHFRYGSR